MKTFTIDPIQRAKLVRALIMRLASTFGLVFIIAIAIAVFYLTQFNPGGAPSSIFVMAAAILVLAVIIAVRLIQQVRTYESGLLNLVITIGSERIDRRQEGAPSLRINRGDVTAMFETENGVLVMTRDQNRFMWVPLQLQNYADAKALLSQWQTIRQMPARSAQNAKLLTVAWGLGTALCVGVLLLATNPWQVIAAGAATLAIYLFIYRLIRQQRGGDPKFRRTYTGVLLFLIVVVMIRIIMTLGPLVFSR